MNPPTVRDYLQFSDYFVVFGALSLLLGIFAYVRRKSIISLLAGGVSGIALVAAGILVQKGERFGPESLVLRGYALGLIICLLLLGRFLPVYLKTKSLYPAGVMAAGAVLGIVAGIAGLLVS